MSADRGQRTGLYDLHNETRVNVASLLQESVGGSREIRLSLDALPLDEDVVARGIAGAARLTRVRDAVLVAARARGHAELECVRCLNGYEQPFAVDFAEEFRQTVDVHSGREMSVNGQAIADVDEDETDFAIDENHELDVAEALRQWIVLELPMRPDCGLACPGPELTWLGEQQVGDSRLAALANLLPEEDRF